jgi:hypothetical protein
VPVLTTALLDRALELASLLVPANSPAVLGLARDLKAYLEALVQESRPGAVASRRAVAWTRGLLRYQIAHDRARRKVLDIVDPETGVSGEEVLEAVRVEQAERELAGWGRALERRERLALAGLSTNEEREEISSLIRGGLLHTGPEGFSSSASLRRRACAWMFAVLTVGCLALALWLLQKGNSLDPWYIVVHVVGTGGLAWWFSKDLFAAARTAETAVRAGNSVLRPRRLDAEGLS